jgi:hypothetical protein
MNVNFRPVGIKREGGGSEKATATILATIFLKIPLVLSAFD